MKRSALVLLAIVAVIGLVVWAGFANLRARRAVMQQQQASAGVLRQDVPGTPGAMDTEGAPSPLKSKAAPAFAMDFRAGNWG